MIIWLASYPKSGNTWLRSFLVSYYFSNDGNFRFEDLSRIPDYPNKIFFDGNIDIKNINKIEFFPSGRIDIEFKNKKKIRLPINSKIDDFNFGFRLIENEKLNKSKNLKKDSIKLFGYSIVYLFLIFSLTVIDKYLF